MFHCKLETERPRASIKDSIYSRQKSSFEQKVIGEPFENTLR